MRLYALINNDSLSISELKEQGFSGLNKSTDGNYAIMHRNSSIITKPILTTVPELPEYVTEYIPDTLDMTKTQAHYIIEKESSSLGASDGWYFNLKA